MIRIFVRGLAAVRGRMRQRHSNLINMERPNSEVGEVILRWVFRNIKQEGRLHEDSRLFWPPHALSTKLARVRRNLARTKKGRNIRGRKSAVPIAAGQTPMLVDTGHLRQGFHKRFTKQNVTVYNNVTYADVHEFGGGHVPQRKLLPIRNQAIKLARPVYRRHVTKSIR